MNEKLKLDQLNRVDIATFKGQKKFPLVVVLDNIRSMNNIGSVFRTADAFNAEKIVLVGITAQPPHRDITKTALGADESVAWEYETNIETALNQLKAEGYTLCAIEQVTNSVSLLDFAPSLDQKYAIIMGNEVMGVSEEALPLVDVCLEIPQFGTKHSLNVSVTTGIVLWDFVQKFSR
jgi:23S rRNA (guanosine2251-2'-O)-methyltransferase